MKKLFIIAFLAASIVVNAQQKTSYKKLGAPDDYGWTKVQENKKFGIVDEAENIVVPIVYDALDPFAGNFARVQKDKKWGFINRDGKEVIPPVYDELWVFTGGIARFGRSGKIGLIDTKGMEICPPKYDEIQDFLWGFARVRNGAKWGAVNAEGKEIVAPLYDEILFDEGLAPLKGNGKTGFIDENYQMVIPAIYDDCTYFSHGSAAVKQNGRWGYIDREGNVVVPITLNYEHHGAFSDGLIAVRQNKKWGFIDEAGKEVIPFKLSFDEVFGFSDGMARFRKGDKYGYMDRTGKVVVSPKYIAARDFEHGVAIVTKKNTTGLWLAIASTVSLSASAAASYGAQSYMAGTSSLTGVNQISDEIARQKAQLAIQQQYDNEIKRAKALGADMMSGGGMVKQLGVIDKTGKELVPFKYGGISIEPVTGSWYLLSHWKIDYTGYYEREWRKKSLLAPYSPWEQLPPLMFYGIYNMENWKEVFPLEKYCTFDMETFKAKKWIVVSSFNTGIFKGPFYPTGVIDDTGKVIIPLEHDTFDPHVFAPHERILVGNILDRKTLRYKGEYYVITAASYGVLDHSGKVIIPKTESKGIELINNEFVMTAKDGGKRYFDLNGKEIRK